MTNHAAQRLRVFPNCVQGFTLVELLVVIAVITLSITMIAPAMANFMQDNRLASQLNALTSSLLYARNAATARQADVVLCPSADGVACSGGADWETGWIIFVDADGDRRADIGEDRLRHRQALSGGNTIESNVRRTALRYSPTGRASSISFWICDSRGSAKAVGITLGTHGRPYALNDANGNGTKDYGSRNRDVSCP